MFLAVRKAKEKKANERRFLRSLGPRTRWRRTSHVPGNAQPGPTDVRRVGA